MLVKEIMTVYPACCTPMSTLDGVARLMVERNCGEIPVVDSMDGMRPLGVVTDRDIVCRLLARGKNPLELRARDCMSSPVVTVTPEDSIETCCALMEENQVRRIPVVDSTGRCCGMISQADIAQYASEQEAVEMIRELSRPEPNPSRVRGTPSFI